MPVRPEENPFEKARRREKELKEKGRAQLVSAAGASRAEMEQARLRGEERQRAIAASGGKAFAGAMGRSAGGIGSVGGLGSLQMDIEGRQGSARSQAAAEAAAARREAEAKEQEITKFDIESEKSVDELRQERANIGQELTKIAESNTGLGGFGENENGMARSIEEWGVAELPTQRDWNEMVRKARDEYGVGVGPNRKIRIPQALQEKWDKERAGRTSD